MSDFIPNFRPRKPKKNSETKWLDPNEPQVILAQGMRGGGKSVFQDYCAEELYREGITVLHLWGARSFENLYWCVNKNCKEKYQKIREVLEFHFKKSKIILKKPEQHDMFISIMKREGLISISVDNGKKLIQLESKGKMFLNDELLHCKCYKAFPITWVVPDYIKVKQDTVDRFNNIFWSSIEEFKTSYNNGEILRDVPELLPKERKLLYEGKLKKPEFLLKKPLVKIRTITPPTSASRKEVFQKQFTDIVLEARKEHRIVVMNPAIFEGQTDKFETIAEIFRMMMYLMNKSGHFTPLSEKDVGKTRQYWTKKQKNWHKIAIVINELRSVSPSSKMHGEKMASSSKKAIFDFIPEARHYKTWFLGDYQNPEDLFSGVRYQANIVVIKRASRNILGTDWTWLFEKIIKDRMNLVRKWFDNSIEKPEDMWRYERIPRVAEFLNYRRPKVDELPDNLGYVTFPNNEIKLIKNSMPSFHHKSSQEDFKADTGIDWEVDINKKSKDPASMTSSEKKSSSKERKILKEMVFEKIEKMKEDKKMKWSPIKDELILLEKSGDIPNMGFSEKTPKQINDTYLKWKKQQKPE